MPQFTIRTTLIVTALVAFFLAAFSRVGSSYVDTAIASLLLNLAAGVLVVCACCLYFVKQWRLAAGERSNSAGTEPADGDHRENEAQRSAADGEGS